MTRVKVTFLGPFGSTFTVTFYVNEAVVDPNDALILAIISAIETLCACVGLRIELSKVSKQVGTAGTGVLVAEDKLLVVVSDTDDNRHIYRIPAPSLVGAKNALSADAMTFDKASAAGTTLSDAIETFATSAAGGPLTAIIEGHRTEGKHLKN
jgi:hypothetical protein